MVFVELEQCSAGLQAGMFARAGRADLAASTAVRIRCKGRSYK